LFNFVQKKVCSNVRGSTVSSTSFSGITQSAKKSDFEEVDEVSRKNKKGTFIRKYNESYLKFGFILCPGTEQLPKPQCVICAVVLRNEAMKSSRLLRHLNTKHL
jgi:hypothetical protein